MRDFDMDYEFIVRRAFGCSRHGDLLGLADADIFRRVKHREALNNQAVKEIDYKDFKADLKLGLSYSIRKVYNDIVSEHNELYNERYRNPDDKEFRQLVDNLKSLYIKSLSATKIEQFVKIIENADEIFAALNLKVQ